ncbi:MAG TPA: hypothetical protein VFE16_01290 [Candidatus Cybelea sp.]|jgi:hypothetical protein|nr:hypothetical protein [Candidatus Cybelea sp.]
MARVSEVFNLQADQSSLDFVDVDVASDNAFYIDPSAVKQLDTRWGHECAALIEDFFDTIQRLIHANRRQRALDLLSALREPNETRLGVSSGRPAGHGLGDGLAEAYYEGITQDNLYDFYEDFEEIALLTEGIDRDILSDITTNIIREPLIRYTQSMCRYYVIRPTRSVASGVLWDPRTHQWYEEYARLPVVHSGPLILVPKVIVRRKLHVRYDEYFQHYILPFRQRDEIERRTALVHRRKDGTRFVTKKDLIARYGRSKRIALEVTRQHIELLEHYREVKQEERTRPLSHEELGPEPDWDSLLEAVTDLAVGRPQSRAYESAVQELLTALFYPWLVNPRRQRRIDNGRRIIDITFDNDATSGFFRWVNDNYGAPTVTMECKNYSADPRNPEVDQLAGRFNAGRGWFGVLLCRSVNNMDLLLERCRDWALQRRSYIIPLTDGDLRELVNRRRNGDDQGMLRFLRSRFDALM